MWVYNFRNFINGDIFCFNKNDMEPSRGYRVTCDIVTT